MTGEVAGGAKCLFNIRNRREKSILKSWKLTI